MQAEEKEPDPEAEDDEFDPFAGQAPDEPPKEGDEGDDTVHAGGGA